MSNSLETLEIWKDGKALRTKLEILCSKFPNNEEFLLQDQILRASRSVTANVAEGYGRYSHQDIIHFFRISRGSLYELIDHLSLAQEKKYITSNQYEELFAQITTIIKKVNGYIKYHKNWKDKKEKHQNQLPNSP